MDMTEQLVQLRTDSTQQRACDIICSKLKHRMLNGHNTATFNFDIDQFPEIKANLQAADYEVIQVNTHSSTIVWNMPFVEEGE